jgi:hypothetical protein
MLKNALDCAFRNIDVSRIMLELEFSTLGHLCFYEISCMWHFLLFRQLLLLEYSTSADSRNINFLLNHPNQQIAIFSINQWSRFFRMSSLPYFVTTNRTLFFHNQPISLFSQPTDCQLSFNQYITCFHNLQIANYLSTDALIFYNQLIYFSTTDDPFFLATNWTFCAWHWTCLTSLAFRPFFGIFVYSSSF